MKQKYFFAVFVFFSLAAIVCGQSNNRRSHKLLFKRDGGGNKVFYVSINSKTNQIVFNITRLNFRDTTKSFYVSAHDSLNELYGTLKNLFKGKLSVKGNFHQPKVPTGTWVHIFLLPGGKKKMIEITNPALRNNLMKLETIVNENINQL